MITNETAKSTYVIADGVNTYAIGFQYDYNPDSTPQIKVFLNKLSNAPLEYGVDYTISPDGLNIVLASITVGDRLDIVRNIPMVQLSDYVIGRIDPEQIERDFDESVMRDQQLKAETDLAIEIPEDHENRIQTLEQDVAAIEDLIPTQATSSNQLADKDFVNSSISTSTATFRGTYSSLADLEAVTADDNDYGFVESVDAAGNTLYSRYKYTTATDPASWVFEYTLNNSSFTAAQWAAINSGITSDIISSLNATTGRNVGDVFFTARKDTGLRGAAPCDGSQYNLTDFTGPENVGALLAAGKLPYVSLSQYATLLSTNGSVGVFGWDGAGTTPFRVPSLNDIFIETGTAAQIGNYIAPGLPNITGQAQVERCDNNDFVAGAFYLGGTTLSDRAHNVSAQSALCFDASRSSGLYGASSTVQPKSIRYRAMIQLACAASDQALETCTNVLADVANLNTHKVIAFQAPTAGNGYTWYRKYADGWVEQGGIQASTGIYGKVTVYLPVAMADDKYQAFGSIRWPAESTWYTSSSTATMAAVTDATGATTDKTTISFSIQGFNSHNWYVCGMAA